MTNTDHASDSAASRLRRGVIIAALYSCVVHSAEAAPSAKVPSLLSPIQGRPALVLFSRADCAPCLVELAHLAELQAAVPRWQIAIASLTPVTPAQATEWNGQKVQFIDLSVADQRQLLGSLQDQPVALPFSLALSKSDLICARHVGLLGTDTVAQWGQTCS